MPKNTQQADDRAWIQSWWLGSRAHTLNDSIVLTVAGTKHALSDGELQGGIPELREVT